MNKKVLILGASGMLGSALYNYFSLNSEYTILGAYRNQESLSGLVRGKNNGLVQIHYTPDMGNYKTVITSFKPDFVINCIGLIKQRSGSEKITSTIPINTMLPHQLAHICSLINTKLIHFSTDCVFSGSKGWYTENDQPDARDLYGLSKLLGEVDMYGVLTLRTSIIGHELSSNKSLLEWFLSSDFNVQGFSEAYFSGLPTTELAKLLLLIMRENEILSGIYHVASHRISKLQLLELINKVYNLNKVIIPDDTLKIDRSLNAEKLKKKICYEPPSWAVMLEEMKEFKYECTKNI